MYKDLTGISFSDNFQGQYYLLPINEKPQLPKNQFLRSKSHFVPFSLAYHPMLNLWLTAQLVLKYVPKSISTEAWKYKDFLLFLQEPRVHFGASTKEGSCPSTCYFPFTKRKETHEHQQPREIQAKNINLVENAC